MSDLPRTIRLLALAVAALALISGCASLPPLEGRTETSALVDTADTTLGRAIAQEVSAHPGRTGIYPLSEPRDAFAARMQFAAAAERSLDAQYYIWHGDETGYLFFEALWQAAERGVRVRLLLDDFSTAGLDRIIAALDAHRNIEVRLYNPFLSRNARTLSLLADFSRLQRRMHNKSFTVDNQISIVGGRNIGNEYFDARGAVAFADLDVIAAGPAVHEVSNQFDLYWNSASAYPAASIVPATTADDTADLEKRFASARADPQLAAYLDEANTSHIVRDIVDRKLAFEWAQVLLLYDDPAKTLDPSAGGHTLFFPQLVRSAGPADRSLDVISPYLVPGKSGATALANLAGRGVKVRMLTNSLASSDVKLVHAGYAKRRRDLLAAGIELYELRPTTPTEIKRKVRWFGKNTASALHAKTFAVDRARVFVGSFNFDPRSELINTEMGLVIDSPTLASRLSDVFDTVVPLVAYEVRLAPDRNGLRWIERSAAGDTQYDSEPATDWLLRLRIELLSLFPIEGLL